jgi:hypothetical protein
VTKRWKIVAAISGLALAVTSTVSSARAAEPRPWLCRDKPVFSSDKPIRYEITKRGGGRWVMTFMHFDPAGGHDGFTVVSTRIINGHIEDSLPPGHWYAVALYRSGSHWICPGNASEEDSHAPGVVSNLCYGEDPDSCAVKLTVRSAVDSGGAAQTHP